MGKIKKKCKRGNILIRGKYGECLCDDCKLFRRESWTRYRKSDKRKKWIKNNRTSINKLQLKWNRKNKRKIRIINKRYRDANKEKTSAYSKKYKLTATGIYSQLYGRRKRKNVSITRVEFIGWYMEQEKKCYYCDIPDDKRTEFPNFFNDGKHERLSVDRIDNNKGYEIGNLILSCSRCNATKSDFFNFKEMKEISQKYIKPKWNID